MAEQNRGAPSCLLRNSITRRRFLNQAGGVTVTVVLAATSGISNATAMPAWVARYPRQRIVKLADVARHSPVQFEYPDENSGCFLVQMAGESGGGVGPDKDIVAFHATCPHMGGPLQGLYRSEYGAAGPCPLHLTSFDLRRHGMVIAGHATESLPQVVLTVEGAWIYATGMMGLIYGRTANVED